MKRIIIFIIATVFLWLIHGIAHSDELIFSDDFERADIGADWTTGAFCDSDTITIVDGRVQATENCNYIETVQEFSGNLRIEVDVEKIGPSDHGCWDFSVLLTELIEYSGIILFDSGWVDGVAIDNEPGGGCGDDVTIPSGVNKGKAVLTYQNGFVGFTFTNDDGNIINAGFVYAGNINSSKIRIHLAAHPDTPRYIDNVKVYSIPTITYTGRELFNHPDVKFPTVQPTLTGDSLVFGPGGPDYGKLLELPIIPAGTFSTCSAVPVSISMNLTRLPCIGSFGCAGAPEDWDPLIGLGDGTNLFAGELSDWYNGEGRASHSLDLGDTKSQVSWTSLFTDAGFPNIGESVDVDVVFILEDTETTVNLSFLDGSGNFTFSTALDCTAELSLLMFLDNDPGEQYQINSVTIPAPAQINVQIDIKPGSYPNSINLKSKGKVPVAILTTDDFDAQYVDPVTCEFAGASPLRWNMEDVDHDGDHDMVMHCKTQELDLTKDSTEATVECETLEGIWITGTDSVNIVPKGNMHSKKAKKKKKK